MTPEQKLMALMAADTPKQPDPAFEFAVLERLARRRAFERFSRFAIMAVVAGGLCLALLSAAVHGQVVQALPLLAAVGAAAIAGLVVWTVKRAA